MKTCRHCNVTKPKTEFPINRAMKDGLSSYCKPCAVIRSREWRGRQKEHLREYHRRYYAANKHRRNESRRRHNAVHPDRAKARWALSNAIRRGKITPQPCEAPDCTATKTEGHHEDYKKALDVRWLCSEHHDDVDFGRLKLEDR
jgi:hypothetical protein